MCPVNAEPVDPQVTAKLQEILESLRNNGSSPMQLQETLLSTQGKLQEFIELVRDRDSEINPEEQDTIEDIEENLERLVGDVFRGFAN